MNMNTLKNINIIICITKYFHFILNVCYIEAVKKSKFNNSNDDEIITSISKWLTSAKGRINNESK